MTDRLQEQREAELAAKFGTSALQGVTMREQRDLYVGAVLTAILTGTPVCYSLANTARNGGC